MRKHLKSENSSPRHGKCNKKSGWLAGMLHVLDFHNWRTKNRPICWKTPRTHSLVREADEQEPFLDSKNEDSKIPSVVAESPTRQLQKLMTAKQVTEYVDFLEILNKEDVFVKILKDPNSEFGKQVQIKSSPRVLPKSGSFPLSGSSRPARIEHKQKENWYAPTQNAAVLTLNVSRDASQEHKPIVPSHVSAVINGFRGIKKFMKNRLKDRKHMKKNKKSSLVSKDDSVGRYSLLLEQSFRRKSGDLRSKSLKLSNEEKQSDLRDDNKPQFFRRVSSLSSLEVLGSFLTELPRNSSARRSVDLDTNLGPKKYLLQSETLVRTEKEEEKDEEQEEKSQETLTLLSPGLGLSSLESYNHEEEENEDVYFCYVKKLLKISGFLENEVKWYSEEQPLNPSLLYKVDIQDEEEKNKELLFDLVNEAIAETQNQSHIYFPKTFFFAYPNGKRFLDQVWRRVEWSLLGLGAEDSDRSLDDIVGRDFTKGDGWMNLRGESEWLTLELEDLIFDEVLDEILCVY
ncbi:Protein TRM32 [Raphanus sativus]|uniref:Protein TRM32 n=1 Tax=Raphanus sativus TaxID=3726 RepID=A0A6J0KRM0_RAPSA|nr:protein TRM32 [Raphanus sativus]XP_056856165.1 protein TRM32-like [Raphanus sativus]KAJ4867950.1 Protein TRM32 [Raphanus sativus]